MKQELNWLSSRLLTQPTDWQSLYLRYAALTFPYTSGKVSTSAVSQNVLKSTTEGFVTSAKTTYGTSGLFHAFWISLFLLSPGQSKLCHYRVACYFLWAPLTTEPFHTHITYLLLFCYGSFNSQNNEFYICICGMKVFETGSSFVDLSLLCCYPHLFPHCIRCSF